MDIKKQIIKSAETCFSQKGYQGATIQDIARTADVNPAVIYRYFSSKRQLFESLLRPDLDAYDPEREKEEGRIIRIALRVFSQRGYNAATMEEIARAAGFTKGGLYAYFPSKQALFRAVLERPPAFQAIEKVIPVLRSKAGMQPETGLTLIAEAYLAAFREEDTVNLMRVALAEGMYDPEIANLFIEKSINKSSQSIGLALADLFPTDQAALVANLRLFFGMMSAWVIVNRLFPQAKKDDRQMLAEDKFMAEKFVRLFLYGFEY
jgi:AcrR family transcriptional regulator